MKKQIRHFSKSTLAVVLTLCMLLSCFTAGIIASDAAKTESESVGANPSSTKTFTAGDVYYVDVRSFSDKDTWCSVNVGAVFFYQDNTDWCCEANSRTFNGSNTETVTNIEQYVYAVTVPSGYTTGALAFFRYSTTDKCWNVTK